MLEDCTEKLVATNPVTVRRRVLWGDCDPAAVVYTPRFSDYVASARDWFLRIGLGVLDRPHPSRSGLTYPMRALSFDFVSFLAADDLFEMTVAVTEIRTRTFSMEIAADHEGARSGRAFTANLTAICFDSGSRQAVPLTDAVRNALERYKDGNSSSSQASPEIGLSGDTA